MLLVFSLCLNPLLIAGQGGPGQEPRRTGPVLIKDFEEPGKEEEKVYPHDPVAARKNFEIGRYYWKRDNYEAAEMRFSEAVEYDKTWSEAYKKLIEVYNKLKNYESAVEVCRKFTLNNPESSELDYFRKNEAKYQEKFVKQQAEKPKEAPDKPDDQASEDSGGKP